MKKIILFLIIIFTQTLNLKAEDFKLNQIISGFNGPWSFTFKNENEILVTEKSGQILFVNLNDKIIKKLSHNLDILEDGQGGLLEILYHNEIIFVSYSENRGNGKSSTSVASANFDHKNLNFKNIFRAEPPINSGYHFGSRLVIKDNFLFITAGERGKGMIAQDPTKHPGSIIRIHLNGRIPKDNPKFKGRNNWLPEIFQIGVRNPQGMDVSPYDNKIYLTNHGARGGDWFGEAKHGENYGWKILGWGGINYTGTKIGPKWKPGFTKAIKYWVPSIAASSMIIYKGDEFKEWNGDALITSLKDQSLRKIKFKENEFFDEKIIFKDNIGRIRDIEIQEKTGEIFLLTDEGSIWRLQK
ncbi:MAG: glucose dehydrogenase [Pelagibacterales bacterium MED-G43]|nr:MAG: glucose dehydrogenase [Pelagibacterales bacterium MED-G43]